MYNLNQRQTAKARKVLSLAILCGLGVSMLSPSAEARLIFTTEEDGVDADAYTIDQDGTVVVSEDTDLELNFGSNLGASLIYNDSTGQFTFNKDLNLGGNTFEDFKIESFTTVGAPTCTLATEAGRMYFDTTLNEMMVCSGTGGWNSVEDSAGVGSITTTEILDGTIATVDISAGAITGGAAGVIADGSITTDDLGTDSVDSDEIAADAVTASEIATGAVTTDEILDGTIAAADLAASSVSGGTAGTILDDSITAADLAADSVTASEIATGAVTTDEILDGTITAADLDAAFEITGSEITDGTITAADLGTDSVDSDEIAADAVTASEIATGAVTTDEILDGTITAADLGTDSVDSDEIAADAVTASEIATGAVTTDEILDGTIATIDVSDDAITSDKIGTAGAGDADKVLTTDGSGNPQWELKSSFGTSTLTSGNIFVGNASNVATGVTMTGDATIDNAGNFQLVADSVTAAEIATDAVDSDEIAADAVTASEIATGAVTTDEILDGTIAAADLAASSVSGGTAGTILDDSITAADLAADSVTASEIATGAVTTDEILDGTITAADLGTDSVDSDEIAADAVTASEIATGAVTTDEILDGTIATIDVSDDAITSDKIGTAGAGDADKVLTTDGSGNPQWELKSSFGTSTLTSGNIFVGNASNVATGVTMTGDATIDNAGNFQLVADSVTAAEIATDAVDSDEIAADAVTASEIATGAVTTDEILDGTIAAADLAASSVSGGTAGTILDDSITAADLAADSVTASEIATGAVTTDEILDGTITAADLGTDSVDSDEIAADAVTASEIATGAVTTDEILDGTITAADLGTDSVDSDEIAADAVTASEIATGAVTTDEILDGTIATIDVSDDAITSDKIGTAGAGDANKVLRANASGDPEWALLTKDNLEATEVKLHEAPEFPNFTLEADGSNNKGTFESDHDSAANKNYYQWSTRKTGALHDYDLVYQWQVPQDFVDFSATLEPLEIDYKTDTASTADNQLEIVDILDTAGTSVGTITGGSALASASWVEDHDITFATTGTFTPGEYVTIRFKFSSKATTKTDRNPVFLGPINFNIQVK